MDKISIVVPVFNGERFLYECLDSIYNQSFKNFEVLLVDDCSTDSSPDILKGYTIRDNRFIYLKNEENKGLSYSRNKGIECSTGEFLFFIDADDILDERCLQMLYDALISSGSDISICAYKMFESKIENNLLNSISLILEHNELMLELAKCSKIQNFAWGKLYKKELFDGVLFPVGRFFEDICTIPYVFDRAKKAVFIESELYFYRQNPVSISKTINKRKMNDFFKSMEEKALFISVKYPKIFKYMSQSFFELFYLRKENKFKKREIENYNITKQLYKKAVKRAPFKQKIKYLLATI